MVVGKKSFFSYILGTNPPMWCGSPSPQNSVS